MSKTLVAVLSLLMGVSMRAGAAFGNMAPSRTDTVQSARVRVADMTRVEVWSGERSGHGARGALIGSVVGGVLGLIAFQAAQSDPYLANSFEVVAPATVAGGIGLGALFGAGVGALFRGEKWERVDHVRLKQLLESNAAAGTDP